MAGLLLKKKKKKKKKYEGSFEEGQRGFLSRIDINQTIQNMRTRPPFQAMARHTDNNKQTTRATELLTFHSVE